MSLTPDQELRRDLLLFSLNKQPDLAAAMEMAAEMERFVLQGHQAESHGQCRTGGPGQGGSGRSDEETPHSGGEPSVQTLPATPCRLNGAADAAGAYGSGGQKRRWSEADDVRLQDLWDSELSLEEIAEDMDRTVPSLYSRARAMGLPRRAPREQDCARQTPSQPQPQLQSQPAQPTLVEVDSKERQEENAAKTAPMADEARKDVVSGNGAADAVSGAGAANGLRAIHGSARRSDFAIDRFRPTRSTAVKRPDTSPRPTTSDSPKPAACTSISSDRFADRSVDPVIQFLRSRDYSVVSVGEGRFQLDGRRILNADELREKANNVRKALGQSPFLQISAEKVG